MEVFFSFTTRIDLAGAFFLDCCKDATEEEVRLFKYVGYGAPTEATVSADQKTAVVAAVSSALDDIHSDLGV